MRARHLIVEASEICMNEIWHAHNGIVARVECGSGGADLGADAWLGWRRCLDLRSPRGGSTRLLPDRDGGLRVHRACRGRASPWCEIAVALLMQFDRSDSTEYG